MICRTPLCVLAVETLVREAESKAAVTQAGHRVN